MSNDERVYGVIGAGSFGLTLANLMAENGQVLIYARKPEVVQAINEQHFLGVTLSPNVRATADIQQVADTCNLIFPVVPSANFRPMMEDLGPFLKPHHFLIHGTKGFDVNNYIKEDGPMQRRHIRTMSEVIQEESVVVRIGCLSGPNLSAEIQAGQPAATLIASEFNEVIKAGQNALRSKKFQVYGSRDIIGAELAGALKNVIALGAGVIAGKGMGQNLWALLLTRGLAEMIHIGTAMGANVSSFLGVAGIGDLVATASSKNSRNYMLGYRFAKGDKIEDIQTDTDEVAEGFRTLQVVKAVCDHYKVHAPITQALYRIFYKGMSVDLALEYLMTYPYAVDVDFL
jgi:glycerol-3-phosphate dehydrogenase (NAD(P)+)